MKASSWRADLCDLMNFLTQSWNRAANGWLAGSMASHTAARLQILCSRESTGRRLACKSSVSMAVEQSVPVMAVAMILCSEISLHLKPTDPLHLTLPSHS